MFDEINDIEWSPLCSSLFASVGKDGRLELWDLKKMNMLDPFFKLTAFVKLGIIKKIIDLIESTKLGF